MLRFFSLLFFMMLAQLAEAQPVPAAWEKEMKRGDLFIHEFRHDSAQIVLKKLIAQVDSAGLTESDFGIRVLERLCFTLQVSDRYEEALPLLYKTIDICQRKNKPAITISCNLLLALQYEKLGQLADCFEMLKKSEALIRTSKLDSMNAYWGNRMSSYYRVTGQKAAALFYAKLAAETGEKYSIPNEAALGHLLQANLLVDSLPDHALKHYTRSNKQWAATGNYHGWSAGLMGISRIYANRNEPEIALHYCDSALALIGNKESHGMKAYIWRRKSTLFKTSGQIDSALAVLEYAAKQEGEDAAKINRAKIAEIESKYQNEAKLKEIAEKTQNLEAVEKQIFFLIAGIVLLLILSAALIYLALRSRISRKQIREKSLELEQLNRVQEKSIESQKLLLSEIHHRVKNSLQLVISMIELQAENTDNIELRVKATAMADRVFSIAAVHNMIYKPGTVDAQSIEEYIRLITEHITDSIGKPILHLTVKTASGNLNLDTLVPLGIILNELLTNSMKHSGKKDSALGITIAVHENEPGKLHVLYRDNGNGFTEFSPQQQGMGMNILKSMVMQLSGTIQYRNEDGAIVEIILFLKNQSNERI